MQRDLSMPQCIPLTLLERGGFWIPAFIINLPWISEDLRNILCLTLPILLQSVKYPGLQEMTRDYSISTPMNSQEGKDVGNDRSE